MEIAFLLKVKAIHVDVALVSALIPIQAALEGLSERWHLVTQFVTKNIC